MSRRKICSHSFADTTTERTDVLKQDKIKRKDLEYIYNRTRQPSRMRRLSLSALKQYDDPYKQRSLNQYRLERSLSLPDTNNIERFDVSKASLFLHRNELVKTRSVTFHSETIALNAAADNDVEELDDILQNDVIDINYKNSSGLSMMHQAAATGSLEAMQLLIENDAEINCSDRRGLTPLDLAIRGGYFDCALILINAGARVDGIINGLQ